MSANAAFKPRLLALALALAVPAAAADSTDVERRLAALESNWAKVQVELAQMHRELEILAARASPSAATAGVSERLGQVEEYAQSLQDELKTVKSTVAAQDEAFMRAAKLDRARSRSRPTATSSPPSGPGTTARWTPNRSNSS